MRKPILAPLALLLMPLIGVATETAKDVASQSETVQVETVTVNTNETVTVTGDISGAKDAEGLNADLAPVYKLPAWVERVESFCPWKSNDGEGYVRVVRTERHGRHQLFLQWIKKGGMTGTDEVLSTRSIEELEQDYIVRLEMPSAVLNPKSCELTTMADSLNNSQRFRFKVVLREPGNYMLQVTQVLGTAEI